MHQRVGITNLIGELGLIAFVGINEYGDEIIEFIVPNIKLDLFYYSCSNKFEIDVIIDYVHNEYDGIIIFANGEECFGYKFERGKWNKIFGLNGNLVKRHKKGGYSANRFARIAEESRHVYVIRICDKIKELNKSKIQSNMWIWGSDEIIQMILTQIKTQTNIKLNYGGFLNFNSNTISNEKYWLNMISQNNINDEIYDSKYAEILEYLSTNPDMLDFDPNKSDSMKYYIVINEKNIPKFNTDLAKKNPNPKQIPLNIKSKYYSKLSIFDYVGVKYYDDSESLKFEQIYDELDNLEIN